MGRRPRFARGKPRERPVPVALKREILRRAVRRTEREGRVAPGGFRHGRELDAGVHAIGKKIVEEAAEVWMAAEYQSDVETAEEISQLIYHLQVLMVAKGLAPVDVYRHL